MPFIIKSTLLSEAYKSQADLEVQLNVAKSNLQLVISNNEMLEEALKRDSSGHSKDVGWRRSGAREGEQRRSEERSGEDTPSIESGTNSPISTTQESRFFKFRFTGSSPNPGSRPGTPHDIRSPAINGAHHLNSPSLPTLPPPNKELEELTAELQKERAARKAVADEKQALEAEIESLSQALFEEVRLCLPFTLFKVHHYKGQQNGCNGTNKTGRDRGGVEGSSVGAGSTAKCASPLGRRECKLAGIKPGCEPCCPVCQIAFTLII